MTSSGSSHQGRDNPSVGGATWILVIIAVVLVVSMVAGILILTARTKAKERQTRLQRRLQAIRAAGQPLTEDDLLRMFPDPPPERDADRILKASLIRLSIPEDPTNLPFFSEISLPRSGALVAPVRTEIVKCLDQNRAALATVPWDQLKIAWISSGLDGGFTNKTRSAVSPMMQLIKLLCLEAVLSADDEAPKEAAQSLLRALMVGRTLRDDLPIHHLAAVSSQVRVCESLERVLSRTSLTSQDLGRLAGELTLTNLAAVKQDILFERCFGLFAARYAGSLASQMDSRVTSPVRKLARIYQSRILYQDNDLLEFLDWGDRCLAAVDMPVSNAVSHLRAIEAENQKRRHVSFLDGIRRQGPSLLSTLEVQVSLSLLREAEAVGRVRATITALAIQRWRLDHGEGLPEKLSDLVPAYLPALPIDPFDDLPFHYKKLSQGYVVYGVGPDFVDDGGKSRSSNENPTGHSDITFTLER